MCRCGTRAPSWVQKRPFLVFWRSSEWVKKILAPWWWTKTGSFCTELFQTTLGLVHGLLLYHLGHWWWSLELLREPHNPRIGMGGSRVFEHFRVVLDDVGVSVWKSYLILFVYFVPCTIRPRNINIYLPKHNSLGIKRLWHYTLEGFGPFQPIFLKINSCDMVMGQKVWRSFFFCSMYH